MSTPQSSGDVHPTRQQLDELDALLRRMLELPVTPPADTPEAAAAGPPEAAAPPEPSPPPVSYVVVEKAKTEEPATPPPRSEGEAEGWIPFRSSWQPSAQTWGPLAESWHQAQGAGRPTPAGEETPPTPPATARAPAQPPTPPAPPRTVTWRGPWPERLLGPLVWLNRAWDACLAPLGGPGRWLSGPRGRSLLGYIGLACLAAALVRAVTGGILPWTR
jgi:hypothetical protein